MDLELFKKEVSKLGIDISLDKLDLLDRYYKLLITWNEKINLTAITDKKSVYLKHFYDSLTIFKVIDLNKISSLCDIGTGAGFPGIVLKIFFPHLKLTLVDSLGKRINFLNLVVSELGLSDVTTVHMRAEEYGIKVREEFDLVTARAVSSFNTLLEFSSPLMRVSGFFVSMRGFDDTSDCEFALKTLGLRIVKKEKFKLPIENSERTLILVTKNKQTSLKYPRRFSEIKRKPL